MKCQENQGRVMGALLVGAVIGGALGILFAPDKGVDTRRKIADRSGDLTDSLKEKLNDFIDEVKDEVGAAAAKANSFMGRG